ncbi:hypothetical protein K488DRAFT_41770 [Vararia minispora EC-137]|uniref:Uncharacterized protein n=1 Tax=Vararia minispora EC-137 TaxID=1314806 RepID=A0ACB8QWY0_9AGAM|nr:hypothetical protein K488DRAFT_41770 [Vararia minispora EC-137]
MRARRNPSSSSQSLSPYDAVPPEPPHASANTAAFPRASSPSGLSGLFSKSARWFSRERGPRPRAPSNTSEPRSSTSSYIRKPKISQPTDPRPILASALSEPYFPLANPGASRSVLDLSRTAAPDGPDSPAARRRPAVPALGDLRALSRKPWSKSADDLSKLSASPPASPTARAIHDRVANYRNASSPSSARPGHAPQGSAPQQVLFPALSPPGSPALDPHALLLPALHSPQHVHARSHSFGPRAKVPSRLGPVSPVRKPSSDDEPPVPPIPTAASAQGPSVAPAAPPPPPQPPQRFAGRGAFPFTFGAGPRAAEDPALLPPPTIVEPPLLAPAVPAADGEERVEGELEGFVSRATDFAGAGGGKAWKPFKAVLRGSKLQLYKPPGDRAAAAVRELFPVGPVGIEEEEEEEGEEGAGGMAVVVEGEGGGTGREREKGDAKARRKRTFWGRGTHPDLVCAADGSVEAGTLDALTHEAVFRTTLPDGASQSFAQAVLCALPHVAGRARFEAEFVRVAGALVSGAAEERKEDERARARWLVGVYERYHGEPADAQAWDAFVTETLPPPPVPDAIAPSKQNESIPQPSSATRALFADTPVLNSGSPDLKIGMPRALAPLVIPDAPPSPITALKSTPSPITAQKSAPSPVLLRPSVSARPGTAQLWTAVEREGFTKRVLLCLPPSDIAVSLRAFHTSLLPAPAHAPFAPFATTTTTTTTTTTPTSSTTSWPAPFVGSDAHPHWLTKLVLLHVFVPDAAHDGPSSRTYARAEVLGAWVRVGECARAAGDVCTWEAVRAALCARPVARLEKTWRRVDPAAVAVVERWVAREEEGLGGGEEMCVPWGADVCERVAEELRRAKGGEEGEEEVWRCVRLEAARDAFDVFRRDVEACRRRAEAGGRAREEECEAVERLAGVWADLYAAGGGAGNIASQFIHVDQFMSLSVAAETRRGGQYEPLFWASAAVGAGNPSGPSAASLLPLLFPEHLPTIALVDRAALVRARLDSGPPQLDLQRLRRREEGAGPRFADGLQALDFGGTVVPLFDGELLLLVQPETAPSRPSSRPTSSLEHGAGSELHRSVSRTPSIRVRPGASVERKQSLARRNSLPSLSQRTSLVIPEHEPAERPVRVVVQAGTLDRLVDVLAHGLPGVSVSIADDNGEMPLRERRTRELRLDGGEFAGVWWRVFRSFVSPLVFFELLRKRHVSAVPATPLADDLVTIANKRTEILEVLRAWLQNGGAQDALNDGALFAAFNAFVRPGPDHAPPQPSSPDMSKQPVSEAWAALAACRAALERAFREQTRRPADRTVCVVDVDVEQTEDEGPVDVPSLDNISPKELVDRIDAMALAAMRNVSEEDLFITADLLEVQSADRLGWFLPWEPSGTPEDVEIQNIYTHLREVAPTSFAALGHDELYRLFPPAIRSSLRAHHVLRRWLVAQLVAPRLGALARAARMEMLLRALEVCRARSETEAGPDGECRCVRSFAEHVILASIVSPESRAYVRPWMSVAAARGVSGESVAALLARSTGALSGVPLTTDLGWLIERMLEVLSLPDTFNSATDMGRVINFDKRRHLCSLVVEPDYHVRARSRHRRHVSQTDLERLNLIERTYDDAPLDMRAIRDEAARESAAAPPTHNRRAARPFQKLILAQLEKNKRDRALRERITRERKQEQLRADRREDYHARAMGGGGGGAPGRRAYTPAQRMQRSKKGGSVAFLQQLIRPISSAFSLDSVPAVAVSAAELDFTPSGKPALSLSVADAHVAPFGGAERAYAFRLDTEDGGHYLLQAPTRAEMNKWIQTLRHVAKAAAQRRLTYLGNSPKSRLEDHMHDRPAAGSQDPNAVFGVDLEILLGREREATGGELPAGAVPSFLERCLQEVEMRGLGEVGIYRIAGATSELNSLRDQANRGARIWPVTPSTDIHAVCDMVKTWFRVLPEPVFPSYSYQDIIAAMKIESFEERIARVRVVVQALPRHNFDLLKRIIEHLDKVTDYEEQNQMTPDALAIVFSPNLLRAPDNNFLMIMANMPHTNKLVKTLISNFHTIFDADFDAEAEEEEEEEEDVFEQPIPEEDEDPTTASDIGSLPNPYSTGH